MLGLFETKKLVGGITLQKGVIWFVAGAIKGGVLQVSLCESFDWDDIKKGLARKVQAILQSGGTVLCEEVNGKICKMTGAMPLMLEDVAPDNVPWFAKALTAWNEYDATGQLRLSEGAKSKCQIPQGLYNVGYSTTQGKTYSVDWSRLLPSHRCALLLTLAVNINNIQSPEFIDAMCAGLDENSPAANAGRVLTTFDADFQHREGRPTSLAGKTLPNGAKVL